MKTKHDLTMILVLLFFLNACAGSTETTRLSPGITTPVPTFTTVTKESLSPDPSPTSANSAQPTHEVVLPPPAGIVYLMDEGRFITQEQAPPSLIYQPQENGTWNSPSPDQTFTLESAAYDQVLYNPQDDSRIQIWPREGLNLCPFNWAPGQPAVLLSVLLPQGEDPGYSCNRGSPVLLSANTQELTILDETASGLSGPAVSPDGQTIAYDSAGIPWLYRFTQGSSRLDLRRFAIDSLQAARFADPAWSPGGTFLAWTFSLAGKPDLQGIAVLELDRQTALLFSPFDVGSHANFRPRLYFSPGEKFLLLDQYLSDQGDFASQVIPLDGGDPHRLDGYFSSWSPRDDWLVYEKKPGSDPCRLAVESPDGSISIPICRGDQARWSPDGSQVISYPYDRDQFWLTNLKTGLTVRIDLPQGAQILGWESSN